MSSESSTNAGSRASNIQKILDRKQKIFQLPRNSKMVKISTYSTCEVRKVGKAPSIVGVNGSTSSTSGKRLPMRGIQAERGATQTRRVKLQSPEQGPVQQPELCALLPWVSNFPVLSEEHQSEFLFCSETCLSPRESHRRCFEQAAEQYRKSDLWVQWHVSLNSWN